MKIALLLVLFAVNVSAQETKIQWLGHASFSITTPGGKVLLIDPWVKNPKNPDAAKEIAKADYILLTHGHRDHVGDAVEIAKKTGAALIANPELTSNLVRLAGFPRAQAEANVMGIGGEIRIADGEVTIAMTPAVHSSSVFDPHAGENEPDRAYGGNPAGFIVMIEDGPTIYHSGDTAYFRDMETLGEEYAIDVALLNIGGHFGMEPRMAARAAKSVRAKLAIPHHFATFPGITPDSKSFADALKKLGIAMYEMKPGETITYRGRKKL